MSEKERATEITHKFRERQRKSVQEPEGWPLIKSQISRESKTQRHRGTGDTEAQEQRGTWGREAQGLPLSVSKLVELM